MYNTGNIQNKLFRRVGRFFIDKWFLVNHYKAIMRLMGEVIIVRAEMRFDVDAIEYIAYSEWFDECKEGEHVPLYHFHTNGVYFAFSKEEDFIEWKPKNHHNSEAKDRKGHFAQILT